jgi:cytochrome c-type biogenesis protein CcmF
MARLGTLGLEFALVLLGVSIFLSLFANPNRRKLFLGAGVSFFAAGCLVLWCCTLLALAFLLNDFTIDYVARHSSLSTPWYYRLSAVWAGQEGSCLLWLFLMTVSLAVACCQTLKADFAAQRRMFLVASLLSAGLLGITYFLNTPFAVSKFPLSDGEGLNPLLRDWAMIVHPPLLFAGYAFLAVVFALVVCRTSQEVTVPLVARWSRLAAGALTAGIALGAVVGLR